MNTPKGKYISNDAGEIRQRARHQFSVSGELRQGAFLYVLRTAMHKLVRSTKYPGYVASKKAILDRL